MEKLIINISINIYHTFSCRILLAASVKMNDGPPMCNARNMSHEGIVLVISLINDDRSQRAH